ncbi:hypothetical protein LTR37_013483 [Vermiconidia calcicola]|uniref:Uncharacterized protein n=1 Tax=Vermiconidia calcicola TaxID=1690605 RepID=A0ACC3MWK1_9PEZI|nr:hypothetical protein LTR37_013483 [Vermiconidia calcicola]
MPNNEAHESFRFLDLPPELRLMIYHDYFAPDTYSEVDLLKFRSHLPPSNLITTCRQVYNEAQQLYERATADFVSSGKFFLNVYIFQKFDFDDLIDDLTKVPPALQIREIAFRLVGLNNRHLDQTRFEARMLPNGQPEWRVLIAPVTASDTDTSEGAQTSALQKLSRATQTYSVCEYDLPEEVPQGLDLPLCLGLMYTVY